MNGNGNKPELPRGWTWARIQDVCEAPQYGWTTSAVKEGNYHLLRTTDITSGVLDWNTVPFCETEPPDPVKYLLQHNDIVISRAGSIGFSHRVVNPKQSVFASYLIRFKSLIDPAFFAFFLESPDYWTAIEDNKAGIALQNINATKLRAISIPVAPLNEQQRIVAKIEELFTQLDAGIEALKRVKLLLKRYRQSVLKAAFEGRLTAEWRKTHLPPVGVSESAAALLERIKAERKKALGKKYKELSPVDTTNLPELPEGWVWASVAQLGNPKEQTVLTGPFGSTLGRDDFVEVGVPLLTIGCLTDHGLTTDKAFYLTDEKAKDLSRYRVHAGDILFSRMATVGRAGLVTQKFQDAIINYHLMRVRLAKTAILPEYMVYYVRGSSTVRDFVREVNHGATRDGINTNQLLDLPVALTTLAEQEQIIQEIERSFSIADAIEQTADQTLAQSDRLRQSILKRAFEGKLVPQDPADEPAEKLLERIRAARESSSTKPIRVSGAERGRQQRRRKV